MSNAPRFCARLWLLRVLAWAALACTGCTLHHSKQALSAGPPADSEPPAADSRFVSEEDSGLSIFGVFVLAEPDHYAVLLSACAAIIAAGGYFTHSWISIRTTGS